MLKIREIIKENKLLKQKNEILCKHDKVLMDNVHELEQKLKILEKVYNDRIDMKNHEIKDLKSNKNRMFESTKIFRKRNYDKITFSRNNFRFNYYI